MGKVWRCFHCNELFRSRVDAALHFGPQPDSTPVCKLDAASVRLMEAELARYREEDTDLHRRIAELEGAHQAALRRAEESGYSKGLADGRQLGHSIYGR
jgi:hypothetical protein